MNNIKALKRIFKQLRFILTKKHKRKLFPLFLAMFITALLELLGVSIILPFVQVILKPDTVTNNKYVGPILQMMGISTAKQMLLFFGIAIVILYIVKNAFVIFAHFFQNDYSATVQRELADKMLHSYMAHPYSFFINTNTAEIVRGCGTDIQGVYFCINAIMSFTTELLTSMLIAAFVIVTEPVIACGVILILGMTMALIVFILRPRIKSAGQKNIVADTERTKAIYQITGGIKELFVTDRKEHFSEIYVRLTKEFTTTVRNYTFLNQTPDRIIEGLCVSGMIAIVMIRLLMNDDMTDFVPKIAALAMASFKLMPSVGKLTRGINEIVFWQNHLNNAYKNMSEAEEFEKKNKELLALNDKAASKDEEGNYAFEEKLEIKNVRWQYENAPAPVLYDASLTIKKGESIALIGASGAGKTTLADVILGLFKPQAGGVYMDGTDVYSIPHSWAKIIGYVPQQVFLLDDTIRANVAFGSEDVSDEDIMEALKRAALEDFVKTLPEGLDTVVGERGVKFSGGQRQRMAIARALYAKPEILVMDEATAALDTETEKAIMESTDSLAGEVTLIIVAHRLTTIRNCDHIYEVKDGRVVERDKAEVLSEA